MSVSNPAGSGSREQERSNNLVLCAPCVLYSVVKFGGLQLVPTSSSASHCLAQNSAPADRRLPARRSRTLFPSLPAARGACHYIRQAAVAACAAVPSTKRAFWMHWAHCCWGRGDHEVAVSTYTHKRLHSSRQTRAAEQAGSPARGSHPRHCVRTA